MPDCFCTRLDCPHRAGQRFGSSGACGSPSAGVSTYPITYSTGTGLVTYDEDRHLCSPCKGHVRGSR